MNEQIRLLAEQATKQVTKPDGHYIVQEWQKVFAQLIVKECMRMCEVAQVGYLTHGLEKEASGAYSVKQYIEEYLGVEE